MPDPLRQTFDEVAETYDRVRPRYPEALFDEIVQLAQLRPGARVLEVGPGPGIATRPMAERGYEVLAVELGPSLAEVARRNLAAFPMVRVEVADFKTWELPPEPFDLVMSATAWHWIEPEIGYAKAAQALKPEGALAILSYRHVTGEDMGFFTDSQDCYQRFMPSADPDFRLPNAETYRPNTAALEASGLFELPVVRKIVDKRSYTTEEYLGLISTFSDHRALAEDAREGLFACLRELLDGRYHGSIVRTHAYFLVLARRKPR